MKYVQYGSDVGDYQRKLKGCTNPPAALLCVGYVQQIFSKSENIADAVASIPPGAPVHPIPRGTQYDFTFAGFAGCRYVIRVAVAKSRDKEPVNEFRLFVVNPGKTKNKH